MKKLVFILLLFVGIITGCKEPFAPTTVATERILVVDGLITNISGNNTITLYWSTPFGNSKDKEPVKSALVSIKDEEGVITTFPEYPEGTYTTKTSEFTANIGKTYILLISTNDGETYESLPQKMENVPTLDSIYGDFMQKPFLTENTDGVSSMISESVITSLININRKTADKNNFRFVNNIIIEVITTGKNPIPGSVSKTNYYGWHLRNIDDLANITGTEYLTNTYDIIGHELNFFYLKKSLYGVPDSQIIYNYLIKTQAFSLNNDAFNYYKDINDQLSAGGHIFDPISSQLKSNMHCTSNKGKSVFGLFEVSATNTYTFIVIPDLIQKTVRYKKINDIGEIPAEGLAPISKPTFWQ